MAETGICENEILLVHKSTIILQYITNACIHVHINFHIVSNQVNLW